MRSIEDFLSYLRSLDVRVWAEGDRLCYRAPKGNLPSAVLAEMRERKAEILDFCRNARMETSASVPALQPVSRDVALPLSFAQQGLWFLDQLEGGTSLYNEFGALRIDGRLHVEALQRSISEIVRRHEVLRTSFPMVHGAPVQSISPPSTLPLPEVDLRGLPETEQRLEVARLALKESQQPFDMSRGPMIRTALLRLADQTHVLLLTMHHIICDRWSAGIFNRELAILYQALSRGTPSPLPELPIQYADFAAWQRRCLNPEVMEAQIQYWRQQLTGAPPLLDLPTDRPRPPVQTFAGGNQRFQLGLELTEKIKDLSQKTSATPFMTLLSGFMTLLYRYTGCEDLVVGSPVSNRNRSETEALIGCFVNTLALRADLSGNPTFEEVLSRVRQVALGALAHQDAPFDRVVEALQPERNLSHAPVFQVMFVFHNVPTEKLEVPGLTLARLELEDATAKFDLLLLMEESDLGLRGTLEYNSDLFDAATIGRMANHFRILLAGIAADPQLRISELPLLSESEKRQLVEEWNETGERDPDQRCIHELFEAQVRRTPDALAAVHNQEQVSYRELNARANQLAHYLTRLGVGPEIVVGICLERSIESVVGLLGILKAGGTYLPLDPAYPEERLRFILKDSGVKFLLTNQTPAGPLPAHDAKVGCLDVDRASIHSQPESDLNLELSPDSLAYVIYTSGSTGKPKGVLISQGSIARHCRGIQDYYGLGSGDRVLQFASLNFDPSLEQILSTLIAGAVLVLPESDLWPTPGQIVELGVTMADLPTGYWQQWVQECVKAPELLANSRLRLVIVGGDTMPPEALRLWYQASTGSVRLLNAYGPTEGTITATIFEAASGLSSHTSLGRVPIGRPVAHRNVYILGPYGTPVPVGAPGELHIGGAGLARGYLNRPDLTAENFVPDPFSHQPGARLYKTGDLARYLPDGNIEFLGRIDAQVKIRGFRIEPGEIEAVLSEHPDVGDTLVVVREDQAGLKILAAYVVPVEKREVATSQLRSWLKEKLPDYMVPAYFVVLENLPLTPQGKVDRRALPAPDISRTGPDEGYVAPQTRTEETLARIWGTVLGLDKVGILDNFFALGGHSLLATLVMSQLRETFAVELPVRRLFESPTIRELSRHIDGARRGGGSVASPIGRVSHEGKLAPSFSQERLWFLNQFEGRTATYNIAEALRLKGSLNVPALEQSFNEIVRRHEPLRTIFVTAEGQPRQIILPRLSVPLALLDLQHLPPEEQSVQVQRLAAAETRFCFYLSQGPLLRLLLLRLSPAEHVLILTLHHIVFDGWSTGVFIQELTALYEAFSQGEPHHLPDLPVQYADFAHWQRQWLTGEILETQISYWKQRLAGVPPVLKLPTDRPRPTVQSFRGSIVPITLPGDLTARLKTLSRLSNTTLFMTVLSVFATLLARYSGEQDILIGSPIANRNRKELESLIGFFVNTLILRTDLSGDPTFLELLERVRQAALDAYDHQDIPFEHVVEALQPERNLSHPPLVQVMFVLQSAPWGKLALPGLELTSLQLESVTAKFDLTLFLEETDQGLTGALEYNSDLFDTATVTRMTGHLRALLEAVAEAPAQRISQLPLLTEGERRQLLIEWNETRTEYPVDRCIHQLFEAQVRRTPDSIAAVFSNRSLTYQELNARANQLAHHLHALGIGSNALIGLFVERSLDMVVGMLGILKAGGAYVPLDPAYPKDRLGFMLDDSRVSALLTQDHLLANLPDSALFGPVPESHSCPVICLDRDWPQVSRQSADNPPCSNTVEDLAYVIYTSGSTGKPKGVAVPHKAVNRLVFNTNYVKLEPHDRMAQASNASFDAATFEIWGALLHGARLVGIARDVTLTPREFAHQLREQEISVLFLTTALFNQLARDVPTAFSSLRHLLFGGEAVDPKWVREVLKHGPPQRLLHVYGPTENTTFSSWYRVTEVPEGATNLPIGRPLSNTEFYILDRSLQPVPAGVPGELYLGGAGLAHGYLNQAELTADRFVPDPFGREPGVRLYKTGDLVRFLADGNIEFLGRADHQVKIRGFRIELGEVESVLREYPGVQDAVVIVREDVPGLNRLVAYVVTAEAELQPGDLTLDLRYFLKERLPEYMVPSAIVMLEALPMNTNGKVDRAALPAPDESAADSGYVAPRNPNEALVTGIWADVLGLKQVGIHDNFFELGGHSLLATQLMSRVQEAFAVELPLRRLFESPTVTGLLEHIEAARREGQIELPPIEPVGREEELCLSFAQERLWFLNQLEPNNPFYNVSIAVRLEGRLNQPALERSLAEIVQRHETLRTTFAAVDGQPVQVVAPGSAIGLVTVDLQGLPAGQQLDSVQRLAAEEAAGPFDLSKGPLLRAVLLRLGPDQHVALLTLHHIVSDGWSLGILIREFSSLYGAFSSGEASSLPALPIQYADFASWQRRCYDSWMLETQLSYWKQQLAGAPPVLKLPTDRPRPPIQSFRGGSERFVIDSSLARDLKLLSRRSGATLFMTLLTAFATLLSRYSDQEDIVIGCPIANRNRQEIEPLIGFFVNTLVLRADLSGNPGFQDLLGRIRQVALDAYAHQDLPFEKLVNEMQPERDLSRNPLFQVMFTLQNAPAEALELPGLKLAPLETETTSALFDLVLDIWETGQELTGVLEYSVDLFDPATISRIIGNFKTLLKGIAADPGRRISDLAVLTETEQRQLLEDWNGVRAEYPIQKGLHQLFEDQVELAPGRVAVVHAGSEVTFAALNQKANQIARLLRRTGVARNNFVGILHERGIDFLAAMLGALKAGAAFLPIDPDYPDDRIRYMIADSQIQTLITRVAHLEKIQLDAGGRHLRDIVFLDAKPESHASQSGTGAIRFHEPGELAEEAKTNPVHDHQPEDLAYMLYTSGSTGLPKGAMVRHDGAVNHIYLQFAELAFHPDTTFLQSAPSSSDISVWQFLAPLLIGGRTVVADFETVCDPGKLFQIIRSHRVTLIELVPAVLKELLEYVAQLSPEERALPALEWAMVTGESVPVPLVNQWFATYPAIKLVNAYGPTEAADDICQFVLDQPLPETQLSVPIGRPLANLTLYVLDRNLNLLPVGVPGEICVSGVGVGAGYWGNEERTRASFVPNPYSDAGRGPVLYRTGDLGRWRPDGTLELLGRLDYQVKIRGFRIELGEIEAILAQNSAVRETAVVVHEPQPDDKRLVAYVVPDIRGVWWQERKGELQAEQISLWQSLHDNDYGHPSAVPDPTFNTVGWDSTYTGLPLSDDEMHEYVDRTVERILSVQPRKVLEIGCGTGLLMFRLARHCDQYWGTDLSNVAVHRLQELKQSMKGLENVTLLHKCAHDLEDIEAEAFDAVVINSVAQYFPSIDYLGRVLEGAARVVKPGGSIFVGDVRSLPLLEAYHLSVQLHKAPATLSLKQLQQRISQQMAQEQELVVDPAFFVSLQRRVPKIGQVQIQPKRGRHHNELTRFRYDVFLRVGTESAPKTDLTRLDWQTDQLTAPQIRRLLTDVRPESVGLMRVSNARVQTEIKALDWLAHDGDSGDVGQLKEALSNGAGDGLDPEDLWEIGQDLSYHVDMSCSDSRTDGCYDVVFRLRAAAETNGAVPFPADGDGIKPWSEYANNPLQEKFNRDLVQHLRGFLKEKLPHHMVPSDFVILDSLPITPSGKIDRRALPAPDLISSGGADEGYAAPRTFTEKALAKIWAKVLGLDQVGVHDNFFELGGHSLKATQVVSRIHKDLGIEVALREIFNQPTIEELAREIVSRTPTAYASIPKVPDAPHYPVSHAQRRLWVLSQMGDSSTAYSMPDALLLEGPIDPQALEHAFAALIQRHESLRTTFITVDEELRQVVHPSIDARLSFIDLSTDSQPEVQARELARQDAQALFDLQHGPLIRFSLLKLAPDRHVLLSNMHHIISDGWSIAVLEREFITLYHAFLQGRYLALPPLRIQYRDFACWQNSLLESHDAAPHRNYWLENLSGQIPALNLPADFPRPAVKTFNGKTFSFSLSPAQSTALIAFSRQNNVTLFMTLAALLNVLLQRYSGQHDIIIGCPVAGRDHADLKDQIGFYVNTLPLRSQVLPHLSFQAFLDQVRQTCTDAYEHQIYPFDRLVHELNLNRDISRSPLFDVMLALQNVDGSDLSFDLLRVAPFFDQYTTSQFDLTFSFEERDHALHATLWYNTDLFLPDRIARLSHHFQQLVASVLDDASQPLGRLNLLPDPERRQILHQFNQAADYSSTQTIVQLFQDQVEKTPQATALVFEDRLLTYRELNARANQLAHHLLALGVRSQDRVGICADRSLDLVVGLLGILKAGAAYVPFDLAYPKDRLAFMLNDSQVQVLLTQQNLAPGLPPHQALVLCLDSDWNLIAHNSPDNPPPQALPEHPAYVIYTSGSTGLPKGTLITHHNVTRLFAATRAWFHFDSRDVWTLFHSYAFDFSVWELWGSLLHGGRLVVVPYWVSRSPEAFHHLLCAQQVTVLNHTPSAFRQLIQADQAASPSSILALRLVIFGGEALDLPGLKPWFERHGDQSPQLVNMYGITETTVHVTYRPLTAADLNCTASLIGAPIPDLQVHILDPFLQPAPIGVPGEIHVAGAGLAPGYLHRPDLTAERFIPNPFSPLPGARLYKSGDLARYLPNGDIEYFGRLDHQVKIRGFRIELGEIEALLASHPDVAHAVVIARQDHPGDSLLAAYLVPKPLHSLSAADLRARLKQKLPDYMLPAAFVFLDTLPLTPNGKIDRRALPPPEQSRPDVETTFVAPRTEAERTIAAIWKQVLNVEEVGVNDNFFDLGGHSLAVIQVHNKLRAAFAGDLSVVELFKYSTVSALSEYLSRGRDAQPPALEQAQERASMQIEAKKARQLRRKARG